MGTNTQFYLIKKTKKVDVTDTIFEGIGNLNRSGWGCHPEMEFRTKKRVLQWLPQYREQVIENYDGDETVFPMQTYEDIVSNLEQLPDKIHLFVEYF